MLATAMAEKKKKMPFGVQMTWHKQADHSKDCYFCLTNIKGFSRKNSQRLNIQIVVPL